MTLEESYFRRRRFVPERMLEYGFSETDSGYTLESVLEDCGFSARLTVSSEGKVKGVVWDPLNEEPYTLFRSDSQNGPFVSTVRSAYTRFLDSVSSQCCVLLPFVSDQANRIAEWVRIRYGIEPDYPFDEEPYRTTGVFRHPDSRKWFGLVMEVPRKKLFRNRNEEPVSVLNVKADSGTIPLITEQDGFFQAYHMSKRNWITILLDDTLEDETVQAALTDSYELTLSHKKGKTK